MKKFPLSLLAAAVAVAVPASAQAQDSKPEVTIGASAGLHDLGIDDEIILPALAGLEVDDSGEVFGGFIAVDFPLSQNIFAGIEGNASVGSGPIDAEYGASARLGYRADSGTKIYVRGGYQEVDVDLGELVTSNGGPINPIGQSPFASIGDYMVGAGIDLPLGKAVIRANVDSIAFDSLRATAGVGFRF